MKKVVFMVGVLSMTSALFAQQVPTKGENANDNPALNTSLQAQVDAAKVKELRKSLQTPQAVQARNAFNTAHEKYAALTKSGTREQANDAYAKMAQAYLDIPDLVRIVSADGERLARKFQKKTGVAVAIPSAISEEFSDAFFGLVFLDNEIRSSDKKQMTDGQLLYIAEQLSGEQTQQQLEKAKSKLKAELDKYTNEKTGNTENK